MAALSVRNLAHALRRHWIKSVSVAVATSALALLAVRFLPQQHYSEARLRLAAQGGDQVQAELLQRERKSVVEQLGSHEQLARVAERIGDRAIAAELPPGEPAAQRQLAVKYLEQRLHIAASPEPGEIVVRGTFERAELPQKIVATLVENYLDQYAHQPRVSPPAAPASDARAALENASKAAAQRLTEAQQFQGELSLAGQRKLLEGQLAEVQLQLLRELTEHEDQERQLAEQLTPQHPQLVAIRQTIDELSRQIKQADGYEQLPQDAAQATAVRIPGEVGILCERRQELRRELAALKAQEQRIAAAEHDVELARSRLSAHDQEHPIVRSADPAASMRFELTLLQPASPPQQSGVDPRSVIAAGILLGLLGGMAAALACHAADPLLLSRSDVERLLELPVIGPIPIQVQPLDVAV